MSKHIYFDLDGTLTDPFEGITKSIAYALEVLDTPVPDDESFRPLIGPPLQETFARLVGAKRSDRALGLYRERFADVGWHENEPYDGIHQALNALQTAGYTLFVATTKPWMFAKRIVEHFGMADYFTAVYGSELDGTRVDKTELLAWARSKNPDSDDATMVGDRSHDIVGGLNNGMHVLGVSYGYGSVEELSAAGAACIVDAPEDLPGALV